MPSGVGLYLKITLFLRSQTLNTVVSKVRDQGQIVSPYERPASLWMMTDDGEICPNIDSEAFEFEGMLHPVVLTALSPPQLVFCSNFAEAEDLPNVVCDRSQWL